MSRELQIKDVEFRPCVPADAAAAVPLIISSGPKVFDFIFAADSQQQTSEFVAAAFIQGRMEMGYKTHTALIYRGALVGVGAIFYKSDMLRFTVSGAKQILSAYGFKAGLKVIARALKVEKIIKPPVKAVGYLGHLGIAEEYRGKGLGAMLVSHLISIGESNGYGKFGLDVSAENANAQRLYERLGFQVAKVNPSDIEREHGALVEHRYMEKSIPA